MSDQPKLCKDCKFLSKSTFVFRCDHPNNLKHEIDYVMGDHVTLHRYEPEQLRVSGNLCTTEAKWFEPKKG